MKISLNWLKQFVDIPTSVTPKKLGELITLHTAEVEEVADLTGSYDNMVVGQVVSLKKHPNADKLWLAQVDVGVISNSEHSEREGEAPYGSAGWRGRREPLQIVCGGRNLKEKMKVAVALPGSWVKWHGEGEPVQLTETKIRGESSFGMICAGEEIGLESDNPAGSTEVRIHDLSTLTAKPGTPLAKALDKNDAIFDIDNKSLTHRPDLWGHYGIAREVAAILKKPLKPLTPLLKYAKGNPKGKLKITIKSIKDCPRFSGCVVTGIEVKESPEWLKSRLRAIGAKPINNIVDITNYVMLELGEPMHAYDRQWVGADELVVRRATQNETLETIDHKKRRLTADDLVIANKKGEPLGLAGLMGGTGSEITDKTTEIILEAANFHPVTIRKMSTRHGLRSDASQRFEKGLDPTLTEQALARALALIQDVCPNAMPITTIITGPAEGWKPKKISLTLDPAIVVSKIGTDVYTGEMVHLLEALKFTVKRAGKKLKVEVPAHRATGDVDSEDDLVEEIARSYGYNKIPLLLPALPIQLPRENTGNASRAHKHAARVLLAKSLGMNEVMNYSFYNETLFKKCGLQELNHIKVLNYLSEDQTHMRVSLIPGLLQSLEKNSHERDSLKLFEFGRTYKENGEFMPLEEKHLALAVARLPRADNNHPPYEPFYEAKRLIEDFFKEFRPKNIRLRKSTTPPPYAHPQKCIDILREGRPIGWVFALHPGVAQAFGLEHRVAVAELNFSELVEKGLDSAKFEPIPKYPITTFDLSVLVSKKTEVETLEKIIRQSDSKGLIHHIELFDSYSGTGIPEDKKSLAFHIQLSDPERAITDQEFKQMRDNAVNALTKNGAEIRGE